MTPLRHPILARLVGAVLTVAGLGAITVGLTVLSGFFSNEARDTPGAMIVTFVVVFILAPGILAIVGALHLFRRSRSGTPRRHLGGAGQ